MAESEVIISVFGAPQVGKSTLIARCEPIICPYCVFKKTFQDMIKEMDEEQLKDSNLHKDMSDKSKVKSITSCN